MYEESHFTIQYVAERKRKSVQVLKPLDVYKLLKDYHKAEQEHFLAIHLDATHRVLFVQLCTIGLVNKCVIHPREVFRKSFELNASAVIVAHNHPAGDAKPSRQDIDVTNELEQAAKIVGINVLDHIIIADGCYSSLREAGHIKQGG